MNVQPPVTPATPTPDPDAASGGGFSSPESTPEQIVLPTLVKTKWFRGDLHDLPRKHLIGYTGAVLVALVIGFVVHSPATPAGAPQVCMDALFSADANFETAAKGFNAEDDLATALAQQDYVQATRIKATLDEISVTLHGPIGTLGIADYRADAEKCRATFSPGK